MNSSIEDETYSAKQCLEQYHNIKNKDELSSPCKEIIQALMTPENGVMENHSLNVGGGRRPRNGLSHAALQRRFTGKMSGVHLNA